MASPGEFNELCLPTSAATRAPRTVGRTRSTMSKNAMLAAMISTLLLGFAGATQAQPPEVDIAQTCRSAAGAMVQMAGSGRSQNDDVNQCLGSEQKAREQIVKDWVTFSVADKTQCVQTKVYLPSYIEWQTCLEMERDVRQLRRNQPAPATIQSIMNDARRPVRGSTSIKLPVARPGINTAARP